jgi:Kef-type K+ transport system membrane component KefB
MALVSVANFLLFLAGMELDLTMLKGTPMMLGAMSFIASIVLALLIMVPLHSAGLIISPLLVATALSATSVGIIIPILRDTGQLDSPAGIFTVAGSSVAEFGTIAMLGMFFASAGSAPWVGAISLAAVAVLAVLLLFALTRLARWRPGRTVTARLDHTSSQLRVRATVAVVLGASVIASYFGFEAILGTFLAGVVVAIVIRGDAGERSLRERIEAIGFGFFVPVFFVTSGLKFKLEGLASPDELARIALFFVVLLLVRGLPALLYRKHLTGREMAASGLLQATNLSFIVVAVTVGLELGRMRPITCSSLIVAGLLSAGLFPMLAQRLLGGAKQAIVGVETPDEEIMEPM